jgi:DNA invertase Pin-like site-specific DNA recombinase
MKQVAIYCRVSSTSQSTRSQEPDLERFASNQDEKVKWFRDTATGTNMNRPGWEKLAADIRAGKVSKLVVWRLDRLGRTVTGLSQLFEELQTFKVNLISICDGLDLATPAGRMMANVLASVAQYETEIRCERQFAGIAAAKAAGKKWGGSKPGSRKGVTLTQAKIIRTMKADGEKITAIAKAVKLSRPTIYAVLKSA